MVEALRRLEPALGLICGLVLMVYPYFVSNPVVEILIGVALIAVPYFVRL